MGLGDWRRRDRDLDDEIASHIEMAVRERTARGESEWDARRAVLRDFGSPAHVKEETREHWKWAPLDRTEAMLHDLRFVVRRLVAARGFTLTAVLSLALGIGATVTMFTVVDAVDFRPLPFPGVEQLRVIREIAPEGSPLCSEGDCSNYTSLAMAADVREQARTIAGVATYALFSEHRWHHGNETELITIAPVSGSLFSTLGVRPLLGRTFDAAELEPGGPPVLVIGYDLWQNRFGGDPAVIGRRISIVNDNMRTEESHTIIGVMPKGFRVLSEVAWRPHQSAAKGTPFAAREARFILAIARLAPGHTPEAASAELRTIASRIAATYPETSAGWSAELAPFDAPQLLRVWTQNAPSNPGRGREMLLGFVAVVLVVAMLNVAALSLVRATVRGHELTIRRALGASHGRLTREALLESMTIAIGGALLGTLVAFWGVELDVAALSLDHYAIPIAVDLHMVAFAAALALVVGLGIGLAPLLQLRLLDAASTFRGAVSRTTRSLRRGWAQRVLVAGEVASALVLLTGGALLAKELHRLRYEAPGYDPRALYRLTLRFPDPVPKVPESQRAMASSLLDAVRGVPGVRLSALAAPDFIDFAVPPRLDSLNGDLQPIGVAVGSAFFRTTGTPIVRGRAFDERDRAGAPPVVIVDETAARMYWPGEDPVGQRVVLRGDTPDSGQTAVVVGVAAPARLWITSVVAPKASPYVYRPIDQTWTQQRKMVASFARVDGSAATVLPLVRRALQRVSADAVDRDDVERLEGVLADALEQHRVDTFALVGFAVFGLLLAAIGVYGSVALSVAQRTREVGIRLALGATRMEVLTRLTRGGMAPVCAGVVIGAYGAYVLTRLLDSFLIGTSMHDPWSFVVGAVVIVAVTLAASLVPARRAWKTDPAVALRAEV